ncbi:MAG TPA: hypothetical protein VGH74_15575 [Planctomycetaceae bacterium]|jgi:hypothetical protein
MPPEIWEILRTNGVLLIALVLFCWWIGPRLDKLLDALIGFIGHMADVKPQLDKLATEQAKTCKFEPAPCKAEVVAPRAA